MTGSGMTLAVVGCAAMGFSVSGEHADSVNSTSSGSAVDATVASNVEKTADHFVCFMVDVDVMVDMIERPSLDGHTDSP